MTPRSRLIPIVLVILAGFVVPVVNAQEQLFPVEGVVVDGKGAAIPEAELVFKAESDTIEAQTGVDGVVRVMLGTGKYAVTVIRCGFETTKLADFSVQGATVDAFRVVLQADLRATDCAGLATTVMPAQSVISELPNVIADEQAYTSKRPTFSDFSVKQVFHGKPAAPKLVTNGQRMFRTRIRDGAKFPAEFAGHYALPRWGCGAGCNAFVIVDSLTGKVFDVPFTLADLPYSWVEKHADEPHDRMAFRPDSRLMKIDACPNEMDCGLYDYVMVDGKGLELVHKELLPAEFQPAR